MLAQHRRVPFLTTPRDQTLNRRSLGQIATSNKKKQCCIFSADENRVDSTRGVCSPLSLRSTLPPILFCFFLTPSELRRFAVRVVFDGHGATQIAHESRVRVKTRTALLVERVVLVVVGMRRPERQAFSEAMMTLVGENHSRAIRKKKPIFARRFRGKNRAPQARCRLSSGGNANAVDSANSCIRSGSRNALPNTGAALATTE